mgnify:CR=1 FL=1
MRNRLNLSGRSAGFRPYILTALAVVASYVLFTIILRVGENTVRPLMMNGVFVCFMILFLISIKNREIKTTHLIIAVIAAGIVMRVGYMLYTLFWARGHDIYGFDFSGHYGYMHHIFTTWTLPQSNDYLFYHPPFEHIVQAIVVKIFSLFQPGAERDALFEASKLVPCFASCAMLFVSRSICRELGLTNRATAIAVAVIAFHPTFYILSASVNNDTLMIFFFMIAVLYTIRWYKSPTMKNILLIAVSIGLSMMTKISGGIVALFTAPVFLIVLIKQLRERRAKPLIGQFAVFALVCLPLALWYPIRNYILFDQPFRYVMQISTDSELYCGDMTIVERFLSFPLRGILNPLYCQPFGDYNIWQYTLKCSLFGEFSFNQEPFLAKELIVMNLAMILLSLAAMIYTVVRGKELNILARYGLFSIWLMQLAPFIALNIQYPFGCSMDFRYIVPTAIIGAIYTGMALDRIKVRQTKPGDAVYALGCMIIGLFCNASFLFYAA